MNSSKYKILIVDDVEENLQIMTAVLNKNGYQTNVARDGLSALRLARENEYHIILLDIMMPIMGGIEICKFLKAKPETASIPVIFLTASDDKDILVEAYKIGGVDYIKKPFVKEELLARVDSRIKLREYEKNLEIEVEKKTKEMAATQIQLMYTLGSIAEGHSKETHLHVKRVAEFTYLLAILYGMDKKEALILKNASSLHDIGKLGVLDKILHKEGTLTNKEYEEMKKHASLGADMLKHSELPLFKTATIVCMHHHEKYDGSGYPNALKGKNIHIYGRIVAIADVFDALSFQRSYKKPWSTEEVVEYILGMKAKHFDPNLINLFYENVNLFLKIYNLEVKKTKLEKMPKKKRSKIAQWLFKKL